MGVSLKLDLSGLKRVVEKLSDPKVSAEILAIPKKKGVAALIGQAIADNFDKEGPGWPPLKARTIRASVKTKKVKKEIADMTDAEIVEHEEMVRKAEARNPGHPANPVAYRRILQKTGLLKKTSSIPNFSGSNKSGSGSNIYQVEGTKVRWGTSLSYATDHQKGNAKKHIPQRKFLVIRPEWMAHIEQYVVQEIMKILAKAIQAGRV